MTDVPSAANLCNPNQNSVEPTSQTALTFPHLLEVQAYVRTYHIKKKNDGYLERCHAAKIPYHEGSITKSLWLRTPLFSPSLLVSRFIPGCPGISR